MIVSFTVVVEKVKEYSIIGHPSAGDVGVWKIAVRHGVVINSE